MRTLDDIVPPSRRAPMPDMMPPAGQPPAPGQPPMMPSRPPRARFPYATALIALIVVGLAVATLFYFSSASVEVTPTSTSVTANGSFNASASGELPFQVITAQKSASQSVASSGSKNVSSSAQGTISIANTQKTTQKLIANTRFQSSAGLIYRIHTAVSIPAGGTATAIAYADQPGASYNSGPTTFTIPGLKGSPQYSSVTATTGGISGGASGLQPIVDTATENSTRAALKTALAEGLATAIQAQVPSGYVLLQGASATSYEDMPSTPGDKTGMINLSEQGTITAVVFPNASLAKAIESALGGNIEAGMIEDASTLSLTPTAALPSATATAFSFSLSGTTTIISTIDSTRIASAVAGKTREAAQVALTNYPEVKQAVLILRPFWRSSFPQDPASIKVVVGASGGQ